MPVIQQFKLPDIGEGLTEADIITWQVAVGDTVEVNQILVEVETAKAAVELPSPWAGVVTELHCAEGETVDVGKPIISIDTEGGSGTVGPETISPATISSAGSATEDLVPSPPLASGETAGRTSVLVGYGPRAEGAGTG